MRSQKRIFPEHRAHFSGATERVRGVSFEAGIGRPLTHYRAIVRSITTARKAAQRQPHAPSPSPSILTLGPNSAQISALILFSLLGKADVGLSEGIVLTRCGIIWRFKRLSAQLGSHFSVRICVGHLRPANSVEHV
jgi:hypothetical protein